MWVADADTDNDTLQPENRLLLTVLNLPELVANEKKHNIKSN